jgi:hypothetical protein
MVPDSSKCHVTIGCHNCFPVFKEAFDPFEEPSYTTCKHTPLEVEWFQNQEMFTCWHLYVGSGLVPTRCIICNGCLCVDYPPTKVEALQREQADDMD